MAQLYPNNMEFPSSLPSPHAFPIADGGSDTELPHVVRQLYVGSGGDVKVRFKSGGIVTFKNVASGQTLGPFFVEYVLPGTNATDVVGLC